MKKIITLLLCCMVVIAGSLPAYAVSSDVKVGDIVTFGTYEQDNNSANGKEAIEWTVLDIRDGKALILSRYGLDTKAYNTENVSVTWEECTLRNWLNGGFLAEAFSAADQNNIALTYVAADARL